MSLTPRGYASPCGDTVIHTAGNAAIQVYGFRFTGTFTTHA